MAFVGVRTEVDQQGDGGALRTQWTLLRDTRFIGAGKGRMDNYPTSE